MVDKILKLFIVISFTALTGCASAPVFIKPAPEKVILGKSTLDEVVKTIGAQAKSLTTAVRNNENVLVLSYYHGDGPTFYGVVISRRYQEYTFFNDKLIGDIFSSTFSRESTEFNIDKISMIIKGKTTRSEVMSLLGKPSGEVMYPLIQEKNGSGLVYSYKWARYIVLGAVSDETYHKLLVTFDENSVVARVSFKLNDVEK